MHACNRDLDVVAADLEHAAARVLQGVDRHDVLDLGVVLQHEDRQVLVVPRELSGLEPVRVLDLPLELTEEVLTDSDQDSTRDLLASDPLENFCCFGFGLVTGVPGLKQVTELLVSAVIEFEVRFSDVVHTLSLLVGDLSHDVFVGEIQLVGFAPEDQVDQSALDQVHDQVRHFDPLRLLQPRNHPLV